MKKFLTVVLACLMLAGACIGFGACGESDAVLKIGYTLYAPMNYYDETNTFVGFDTELAQKVCADLGYKAEFVEIDWNTKLEFVNSKKVDLIWNGMTITPALKEALLITEPYLENQQVLVVRSGDASKYSDIASISKAGKIAVESGSAGAGVIKSAQKDGTLPETLEIKGVSTQKDTLLEVSSNRVDAAVIDVSMAKAMTGEGTGYAGLTYVNVGFDTEYYGIGMSKDNKVLCYAIDYLIDKYEEDGSLQALKVKYGFAFE